MLDTNLSGAYLLYSRGGARHALPAALAGGASLISCRPAPTWAKSGRPRILPSKRRGVVGLTRTLAREFGRQGVLVNAIAPGLIETDMLAGVSCRSSKVELLSDVAVGRVGHPGGSGAKWWCFSRRRPPVTFPDRSLASMAGYSKNTEKADATSWTVRMTLAWQVKVAIVRCLPHAHARRAEIEDGMPLFGEGKPSVSIRSTIPGDRPRAAATNLRRGDHGRAGRQSVVRPQRQQHRRVYRDHSGRPRGSGAACAIA